MPTLDDVNAQIAAISWASVFGTRKEVADLPQILAENERILGLTSGMMNGNTWLVVCTDRRVIFLDRGLLFGLKQVETPLEKINSIEQHTGLILGKVVIWDGSSKMTIENVAKATVRPFVASVNEALSATKARINVPSNSATVPVDLVSQLERLAALVDRGVLTAEEFRTQKQKLLSG